MDNPSLGILEPIVFSFQFFLVGLTLFLVKDHFWLVSKKSSQQEMEFWHVLMPKIISVGLSFVVVFMSFLHRDNFPFLYRQYSSLHSALLDVFLLGIAFNVLLAVIRRYLPKPSSTYKAHEVFLVCISLFLLNILLLPTVWIDWSSSIALAGTCGKMVAIISSLILSGYVEQKAANKKYRSRKKFHKGHSAKLLPSRFSIMNPTQAGKLLGVNPQTATRSAIQSAYRQALLTHHPDKVPAAKKKKAHEKTVLLQKAYDTLMNTRQE